MAYSFPLAFSLFVLARALERVSANAINLYENYLNIKNDNYVRHLIGSVFGFGFVVMMHKHAYECRDMMS